jgi:thiol-disulfide isomerase/thioredoxin
MRTLSHSFRAVIFLIGPAFCFVFIVSPGPAQTPNPAPRQTVELREVKYSGLVEAVKAERGKVVVVDVWSTTCPPCLKNFPHVLQMQKELGPKGLVCFSVSVDPAKYKPKALEFLKGKDSTITNFWLDETPENWATRWGLAAAEVPVMFVFDREGRRAGKFGGSDENPVDLPVIDKLVKELLQANSMQ